MENLILPALIGFLVGLPAFIFAVLQWTKTWRRESRQIAANAMEEALIEGQKVRDRELAFEQHRRQVAEAEKEELEEEEAALRARIFYLETQNENLRNENSQLRAGQLLINEALRGEERRMTDDRDGA